MSARADRQTRVSSARGEELAERQFERMSLEQKIAAATEGVTYICEKISEKLGLHEDWVEVYRSLIATSPPLKEGQTEKDRTIAHNRMLGLFVLSEHERRIVVLVLLEHIVQAKDLALELNRSPRTPVFHFDNLKRRSGSLDKTDLVLGYLEFFLTGLSMHPPKLPPKPA